MATELEHITLANTNDRLDKLKMPQFKRVFTDYHRLYSASRIARYLSDEQGHGFSCFTDYMNPEVVVSEIVYVRLYRFEQRMLPMLSPAGQSKMEKVTPPAK